MGYVTNAHGFNFVPYHKGMFWDPHQETFSTGQVPIPAKFAFCIHVVRIYKSDSLFVTFILYCNDEKVCCGETTGSMNNRLSDFFVTLVIQTMLLLSSGNGMIHLRKA